MQMDSNVIKFLLNEFFIYSWGAAIQRNTIYIEETDKKVQNETRQNIEVYLLDMLTDYINASIQTEEQHCQNITDLYEYIKKCKGVIENLTYGFAQKLLNMMLKYLWCVGLIREPLHLPIDRLNLQEIGLKNFNWTQDIKSIQDYKILIDKFKNVAKEEKLSLAYWELKTWKRRNSQEGTEIDKALEKLVEVFVGHCPNDNQIVVTQMDKKIF